MAERGGRKGGWQKISNPESRAERTGSRPERFEIL